MTEREIARGGNETYWHKADGPVHKVEVEVVCSECVECLLKTLGGIRLVRVPQLARDEDLLPGHARVLDALPDLVLVHVDECCVNVAVSVLKSDRDRVAYLARRRLPRSFLSAVR